MITGSSSFSAVRAYTSPAVSLHGAAKAPAGQRTTTPATALGAQPSAVVRIGAEAQALAGQHSAEGSAGEETRAPTPGGAATAPEEGSAPDGRPAPVSEEEQLKVNNMRARDREVRTHEQAHKSAGGAYAGAVNLEFDEGPDGKRYAVAGHVDIDVGAVKGDPEATIRKMAVVARAATAPADPSGADRAVAAQANATAAQARADLAAERLEAAHSKEAAPADAEEPKADGAPGAQSAAPLKIVA